MLSVVIEAEIVSSGYSGSVASISGDGLSIGFDEILFDSSNDFSPVPDNFYNILIYGTVVYELGSVRLSCCLRFTCKAACKRRLTNNMRLIFAKF